MDVYQAFSIDFLLMICDKPFRNELILEHLAYQIWSLIPYQCRPLILFLIHTTDLHGNYNMDLKGVNI